MKVIINLAWQIDKKDKNNLIDRIDTYRKQLDLRCDSVEPSNDFWSYMRVTFFKTNKYIANKYIQSKASSFRLYNFRQAIQPIKTPLHEFLETKIRFILLNINFILVIHK